MSEIEQSPACEHSNFVANVRVKRLSQYEGGPITSHCADIDIKCADCGQPFEFIGLPVGVDPYTATVSADKLELRAAITPPGKLPPAGLPRVGMLSSGQYGVLREH